MKCSSCLCLYVEFVQYKEYWHLHFYNIGFWKLYYSERCDSRERVPTTVLPTPLNQDIFKNGFADTDSIYLFYEFRTSCDERST